jgi:precorrin-4/cobalt-precorrin-4 C11-methyltransferase
MVYFIGAGPGDPDLITVKGKRVIEEADRIIYAGSLVNPQILEGAKPEARIYNSASMTLPQVIAVMEQAEQEGKMTARVHTGDPSLYGAVREQMTELEKRRIQYEVIPGVSSFLAAGAALKREYTLPGVSQSVILTRMEGRTPVPEKESLEELAKHGSTMVIFLSVGQIRELCRRLKKGGYGSDTPAAVVYKASWEDEIVIQGTLRDLAEKVEAAGIRKTALVVVGEFLGDSFEMSKLYDPCFSHEYRKGADGSLGSGKTDGADE